eukprot:TRINITY_DN19190_c0_g1_i1.p1 TRINITY_DN19190_c0_g1~~TRINITY_DN19190_c0_g1_i1.p1  ORF type:complete len:299 (-),score=49.48 TRINITY_DN19190_c0_g1_i1:104-1000(-)
MTRFFFKGLSTFGETKTLTCNEEKAECCLSSTKSLGREKMKVCMIYSSLKSAEVKSVEIELEGTTKVNEEAKSVETTEVPGATLAARQEVLVALHELHKVSKEYEGKKTAVMDMFKDGTATSPIFDILPNDEAITKDDLQSMSPAEVVFLYVAARNAKKTDMSYKLLENATVTVKANKHGLVAQTIVPQLIKNMNGKRSEEQKKDEKDGTRDDNDEETETLEQLQGKHLKRYLEASREDVESPELQNVVPVPDENTWIVTTHVKYDYRFFRTLERATISMDGTSHAITKMVVDLSTRM